MHVQLEVTVIKNRTTHLFHKCISVRQYSCFQPKRRGQVGHSRHRCWAPPLSTPTSSWACLHTTTTWHGMPRSLPRWRHCTRIGWAPGRDQSKDRAPTMFCQHYTRWKVYRHFVIMACALSWLSVLRSMLSRINTTHVKDSSTKSWLK